MKTHETVLPEGYKVAKVVDAKNTALSVILNIVALVVTVAVTAIYWLTLSPLSLAPESLLPRLFLYALGMFVYIIVHELLHGIAYKSLTHEKLTFGITLTVAYCGVPKIFVYRKTALIALLTPFAVCGILFLCLSLLLPMPVDRLYFGFLLGLHLGGCSGDLYGAWLYLTKFKNNDTLMQDTGPCQTFYTKA